MEKPYLVYEMHGLPGSATTFRYREEEQERMELLTRCSKNFPLNPYPDPEKFLRRYTADPIMQIPWMTIPYKRFGLPEKRNSVVMIAIPHRVTMTTGALLPDLSIYHQGIYGINHLLLFLYPCPQPTPSSNPDHRFNRQYYRREQSNLL
jgi:hypothetical protein